jgi:2-C-methyl-D-erythritol 4-phosphate cytidylyltransferase
LAKVSPAVEFIAVHDAVRPCVTTEQIDAVFAAAKQHGAAILAARVTDTLKRVEGQFIRETPSREGLWFAQTPQVFRRDVLEAAYARRESLGNAITDDAQLVEAMGLKVAVVEGAATNIKITTRDDLVLAAAILKARPEPKAQRPIHPFADEEMWK